MLPQDGRACLGLPIAKTIVEAHEGRIEAESRQGQGTRMSIYLPLLPTDREQDLPEVGSREDAAPASGGVRETGT